MDTSTTPVPVNPTAPESEWTCRNAFRKKDGEVIGAFVCSKCGCRAETWFETPHGDRWSEPPRYCPSCGAKVVDE